MFCRLSLGGEIEIEMGRRRMMLKPLDRRRFMEAAREDMGGGVTDKYVKDKKDEDVDEKVSTVARLNEEG